MISAGTHEALDGVALHAREHQAWLQPGLEVVLSRGLRALFDLPYRDRRPVRRRFEEYPWQNR
eukprot:COSAG05_NODE_6116_length_1018_cov_2.244565_2_plen_63_part_00